MRLRKLLFFTALLLFFIYRQSSWAKADEALNPYEDDISYDDIQKVIDDCMGEESFSFGEFVSQAIASGEGISVVDMIRGIFDGIKKQLAGDRSLVFRFIGITIFGAIFTNFSRIFRNGHVSEIGFYITYLLIFSLACASFFTIVSIAAATLSNILDFMRALVPAYYISLTFSSGVTTSGVFYQATLIIIQLVETFIIKGILPFIRIYFVLSFVNYLSEEDLLSKVVELIEMLIKWALKGLLGLITGYNLIQGLIVPVADSVKSKMAVKVAGAIPGVGDLLSSAAETVLGAGIVLKNAIGAAGICVLVILLAIPLLRIGFYGVLYKFASAVVQPVSDKRIVECLNGASRAAGLLIYAVFTAGVLFLLTILVVMATTNGRI